MQIIYPKRLRYPHRSANHLQATAMVCSFARQIPVHIYPCIKKEETLSVAEYIHDEYHFSTPDMLKIHTIPFSHLSLYNLALDMACVLATWKKDAVFYTREINRGYFALQVTSVVGRNVPLFHEVHDFKDEQKLRRVFHEAAGIIFIHESIQEEARARFGYHGPSCIAYSGFDPQVFFPRSDFIEPDSCQMLGYVGTLREDKGVDQLLEVMALLPDSFRLKLIGPDKFHNRERLATLLSSIPNVSERVVFTGQVSHARVPDELADVTMLPVPPVPESMFYSQIKIFEALASGIPLVVTPHPHIKNILVHNETAWVSEGFSPKEMANAIVQLAAQKERQKAIGANAVKLATGFSWDARADLILSFMRGVLEKEKGEEQNG